MSDAGLFIALFGGLFVLRFIAATVVFLWILPDGNRCPNCDAETLRVESRGLLKIMPWFRSSWCYECEWHGMHRVPREARPTAVHGFRFFDREIRWSRLRDPKATHQKPSRAA